MGKALGDLERGTATKHDSGRHAGPASWSPAPEARPSAHGARRKGFEKSAAALRVSNRRGGLKGQRSLRADKCLDTTLGMEA